MNESDISSIAANPLSDSIVAVIFDLEFTAWEGSLERDWQGPNEDPEVIQFGAVQIHMAESSWIMQQDFVQFVKPHRRSKLSSYIKNLTGITQKTIDEDAVSFPCALQSFFEFVPPNASLCVNGNDWEVLEQNCRINNVENPFKKQQVIDVRPFIANRLGVDVSSDQVHSYRLGNNGNLPNRKPHDALSDACAIAQALINFGWRGSSGFG